MTFVHLVVVKPPYFTAISATPAIAADLAGWLASRGWAVAEVGSSPKLSPAQAEAGVALFREYTRSR